MWFWLRSISEAARSWGEGCAPRGLGTVWWRGLGAVLDDGLGCGLLESKYHRLLNESFLGDKYDSWDIQ